jgi:hypothetical protein
MNALKVAGKSGAVVFGILSFASIVHGEILMAIYWMMAAMFCLGLVN